MVSLSGSPPSGVKDITFGFSPLIFSPNAPHVSYTHMTTDAAIVVDAGAKRFTDATTLVDAGAIGFTDAATLVDADITRFTDAAALVGAATVPIVPIGYSLGVELTYPINPAAANGFMISIGMVWAVILTLAGGPFAEYSPLGCMGILVFLSFVGSIISLFVKEDLRRTNATSLAAG